MTHLDEFILENKEVTPINRSPDIEKIGQVAEKKIQEWAEFHNYKFIRYDQTIESFAPSFRPSQIKRPDYELQIHSVGKIAVEVKSRKLNTTFDNFTIDEEEIQKLLGFQAEFYIPVWIAISCPDNNYNTWYWISLNDILIKGKMKTRIKDGKRFRAVIIKDFITIGWKDGVEKLVQ